MSAGDAELRSTITDDQQRFNDAQIEINKVMWAEVQRIHEFTLTTSSSLSRSWKKIAGLWIFAAGGYVMGAIGIVLAVMNHA